MTDNDIIKAKELIEKLEEAYNAYYDTSKSMPYDIDTTIRETAICLEHSIDLINRQKAEIERLQYCNEVNVSSVATLHQQLKTARAKAITEFEQKVFDLFPADKSYTTISIFTIMQIAKEMKKGVTDTNVGGKEEGEQE